MPSNAGLYCGKERDKNLCANHTGPPKGVSYLGWFSWADEMSKTHIQRKCKGCGLYKIWVPRKGTLQTEQEYGCPLGHGPDCTSSHK